MGISALENLNEVIDAGQQEAHQVLELPLVSRHELWDELINLRQQFDDRHRFLKPRGGSTAEKDFGANILSVFFFSTRLAGDIKDYFVVHTVAGNVQLWEKDDVGGPDVLFASGFSTTDQIRCFQYGTLIYLFDFNEQTFKVYDISRDEGYDWLSLQSDPIVGSAWISGDWDEENIWGFEEGAEVFAFPKGADEAWIDPDAEGRTREEGILRTQSYLTQIENIEPDKISFLSPSGKPFDTQDFDFGLIPASPDLSNREGWGGKVSFDLRKAVGTIEVINTPEEVIQYVIYIGDQKVPDSDVGLFILEDESREDIALGIENFLSQTNEITNDYEVTRDGRTVYIEALRAGSEYNKHVIVEIVSGNPGDVIFTTRNISERNSFLLNPNYQEPRVHRCYMLVDLLVDGSLTLPGRPHHVFTGVQQLVDNKRVGVKIHMPVVETGVFKRYLFASRWQGSATSAFSPSSVTYPNGPWMLVSEIDVSQHEYIDRTPDSKLLEPLSNFIPMSGGIPSFFGPGQIVPRSAAITQGALIVGGYQINRPAPDIYNATAGIPDPPVEATKGNIMIDNKGGDPLSGGYELSFLFEYTDGYKSSIYDSGQQLTDGEDILSGEEAGVKAQGEFIVKAVHTDGSLEIQYPSLSDDSQSVEVSFLGSDSPQQVAGKIESAINADNDIQLTALAFNPDESGYGVRVTEKSVGADKNNNSVFVWVQFTFMIDISPAGFSLSGGEDAVEQVDASANQVVVHSLNGLVSKVFVLAKSAGPSYKLLDEFDYSSPKFHGLRFFLPNVNSDVQALDDYSVPESALMRENIDLSDHIIPGVPPQQLRISEQARIENSSSIRSIVPTLFDKDRTQMRFRLAIFTDRDLQTGYLVFGQQFQADFEVSSAGQRLSHPYGAFYIENILIFQGADGVYAVREAGAEMIVDRRAWPVADNNLQAVVFNRDQSEYWLVFSNNEILAWNPRKDGLVTMKYNSAVRSGVYAIDKLTLAIGQQLFYSDLTDQIDDDGVDFDMDLLSMYLGDPNSQIKILELSIAGGDGLEATVQVDRQKGRLESPEQSWGRDFSADISKGPVGLNMSGAVFPLHYRSVMPRLRLRFAGGDPQSPPAGGEDDRFISHITMRSIQTVNEGKARQS